jgi:hypothetical protein
VAGSAAACADVNAAKVVVDNAAACVGVKPAYCPVPCNALNADSAAVCVGLNAAKAEVDKAAACVGLKAASWLGLIAAI